MGEIWETAVGRRTLTWAWGNSLFGIYFLQGVILTSANGADCSRLTLLSPDFGETGQIRKDEEEGRGWGTRWHIQRHVYTNWRLHVKKVEVGRCHLTADSAQVSARSACRSCDRGCEDIHISKIIFWYHNIIIMCVDVCAHCNRGLQIIKSAQF